MIRRPGTSLLTIALVSVSSIICHAQSQPLPTHHVPDVTLNGQAKLVGRLPANQTMRLVVALPLRDQAGLTNTLHDLYNPSSPMYHQWLTVEEFTALFGPTEQDYKTVQSWAKSHGLTVVDTSRNRVNLQVTGSVADIEAALHVTMGVYQHPTEDRTFYAPDREPTTPDLSVQLWHVSGLDNYSIPHPLLKRRPPGVFSMATTGSGPDASFLGSDMRAAYYESTALTGTGQTLGLLEYYGTDLTDLDTYYSNVDQTESVPVTLDSTDGTSVNCTYPSCDDTEQTIDMTQALGMAPGLAHLVMFIGSTDSAILNGMATYSPLPAQLSCSWGWTADPSTDNTYFEEFAAQGQNFFAASGDDGKWSSSNTAWPADGVYDVVSVGGTDLTTSGAAGPWASESGWSDGGGGVSPAHVAIPTWQTPVDTCPSCSQTYRNGPDVAANANFTYYVCADQEACTANEYGGTSFAAPLWAGYLALTNEQGANDGKSALGYINPTLYSLGENSSTLATDFHNITSGGNGYTCSAGYNLCDGWGSMNGSSLLNALLGSTSPSFTLSASPSSLTITQGSSGTSTITVNDQNGFTGSVTLAASGLPSGVTATFGTNPTTGTSLLTLTASSSATTGTATVTITGTSGTLTATTTIALTVNSAATPNFTIGASPSSLTITQGSSGTSTITITSQNSFNSATTLSASGLPSGVTAGFSPNPVTPPANGSTTSTLTLTASGTATTGTVTVTITGTSGSLSHSTTISLTVSSSSSPNFTMSISPSSLTVDEGGSASNKLTITSVGGFSGAVYLSVNAFPSGVSATTSAQPVEVPKNGSASATITWSATRKAPTGTYTIELIGDNSSGSIQNEVPVTLTVAP